MNLEIQRFQKPHTEMLFFGQRGYRGIAHDRRGHGRFTQTWEGNEMDTYADDLAQLTEKLDVKDAIHVGHSTRGGKVARYIGRHGSKRVAKAVLIGAVPPLMLKTAANPGGLPTEVFDGIRSGRGFQQGAIVESHYGTVLRLQPAGREGFRRNPRALMGGVKAHYDCIKAFSETDFTEDLKKIDVPTLILHGDDDQIVPLADSAILSAIISW